MIWETIERVNRLRQQALSDPEFVQSAKAHEQAIRHQESYESEKSKRSSKTKERSLADIYKQTEFAARPDERQH
tara:strand:- start:2234 stop:2455 length:222 start_codon:yes stop_codon:yes gene_type:complete